MSKKNRDGTPLSLAATPDPLANEIETLGTIVQELGRLRREAGSLTAETRETLEAKWTVQHTEIFPQLCRWKEEVQATTYSTFTVAEGALAFQPLLSDADSPQFSTTIKPGEEQSTLMDKYSSESPFLLMLALGSREMQFDFHHGVVAVPLVLFEKVCGVFLARIPSLTPQRYEFLTSQTTEMLNRVRDIAVMQSLQRRMLLESAS